MQAIAIGYARVSTEGQAVDGVSLDAQRAKFEAWCLANDWTVGRLFVDAGVSGKRADNRPELQRALELVCRRRRKAGTPAPVLVVYSLSRLARSLRDAIDIGRRLDKAGANLVSVTQQIDTTNAAGRLFFHMLAAFDEFERAIIAERTSSALQHMRSEGKRVGSIPFGFELADDGETLRPIEAEQAIISRILDWRRDGLTLWGIVERLHAERILTKHGKCRWHPQSVSEIVKRFNHRGTEGTEKANRTHAGA